MERTDDAKFTNIELTRRSDLFHVSYINKDGDKVSVPLLKFDKGSHSYTLNIDANNFLDETGYSPATSQNQRATAPPGRRMPRLRDIFPSKTQKVVRGGGRRYPVPQQQERVAYLNSTAVISGALYYGDLDGDGEVNARDALILSRIAKGIAPIDGLQDVNGIDRRMLAYMLLKPLNYTASLGAPTNNDVYEVLKYVTAADGYTSPAVFAEATSTPTTTVTESASEEPVVTNIVDIGNNWKLKTMSNAKLQFVNGSTVMAQITPIESGDIVTAQTYPNNGVSAVSDDWKIMYPGVADEGLPDEDPAKQLKFVYKGYPQTLVIPNITALGGKVGFAAHNVSFGNLWQLYGESASSLKFYYRSTQASLYYPQVVIGTPEATLNRYIAQAKKLSLI